jgi:hypothetical protein
MEIVKSLETSIVLLEGKTLVFVRCDDKGILKWKLWTLVADGPYHLSRCGINVCCCVGHADRPSTGYQQEYLYLAGAELRS